MVVNYFLNLVVFNTFYSLGHFVMVNKYKANIRFVCKIML